MSSIDHRSLQAGFSLCTLGRREILVNGQVYVATPGVICVNSPIVTVVELSRSADYAELRIFEDITVLYGAMRQWLDTLFRMQLWRGPCLHLPPEGVALFRERKAAIDEKRRELERVGPGEEQELLRQMLHLLEQETFMEFMLRYYRNNAAVAQKAATHGESLAFRFIHEAVVHFKEKRRVGDYAAMLGLSASRLTHLVKEKTGRSPSAWLIIVTVIRAQDLLRDTAMSVKEIAAQLSFPEQFTFRKFFKQHTGLSPTAYRRSCRQGGGDGGESMPSLIVDVELGDVARNE